MDLNVAKFVSNIRLICLYSLLFIETLYNNMVQFKTSDSKGITDSDRFLFLCLVGELAYS